jgi:gliding motility-associated-like protein
MKFLPIAILFALLVNTGKGQSCQLNILDTVICSGQEFRVWTENSPDHLFRWTPPGELTVVPFIDIELTAPETIYMEVFTRADTAFVCKDSVSVTLHPKIAVEFEQSFPGCPGDCNAQVRATASGGYPPFRYEWGADVLPSDSSQALGLCTESEYTVIVYDSVCAYDTAHMVEAYSLPEIEIITDPVDTIYTVNPRVTFYYDNLSIDSIQLTNFFWDFGDGTTSTEESPSHVFNESDTVRFAYTTIDGCDSAVYVNIPLRELELTIPNVFTPNGDQFNQTFEIPDLDKYVENELVVVNRWGQKVYEEKNYSGGWDGGNLSDGTYFYILKAVGLFEEEVYRGSVTILGSNNK